MAKLRLAYIDFMKGVCIMLIVMHHTDYTFFDSIAPNLDNALQSFRVPMYYFLSGLFFKTYSGFPDFLRRKVNNLVVPLMFFHVTGYLVAAAVFPLLHPEASFDWTGLLGPLYKRKWAYTMPLWFLMSLFEVNIIYYLMRQYLSGYARLGIVAIISLLPILLASNGVKLPLLLDTAFVGLPFFVLGTAVKNKGWLSAHRYDKWGLLVFPIIAIIVYCFAGRIDILTQQFPGYVRLYVLPMASILSLMWLCKNFRVRQGYRIPVIGYWGQYSLVVLGTHDWLLTPLDTMLADVHLGSEWLALLKWGITMVAMFVIIPIMIKLFPRFTAQAPLLPIKE